MVLRPGEMAPTDGVVRRGETEMDESSITGESKAVDKAPGDLAYAGALNGTGAVEIEVTRLAEDSTLARIVKMVESAQAHKARSQRFLDRAEGIYAWSIVVLVALLIVVPWSIFGHDFRETFYRAMTLLVVASPCALVISTPAAILSAIANGARQGILFKGGAYLENMADVKVVVFDKTGTLTTGKPGLSDIVLARHAPPEFSGERRAGGRGRARIAIGASAGEGGRRRRRRARARAAGDGGLRRAAGPRRARAAGRLRGVARRRPPLPRARRADSRRPRSRPRRGSKPRARARCCCTARSRGTTAAACTSAAAAGSA